jgi:diguanylate cyclase (GGDEF)-like protein
VTNDPTHTALTRTIASTETLKIAGIHTLDLFYTPLEERFERLTRLARRALGVPVAAITVLNHEKQWFKSVAGWAISELPLERTLCQWAVRNDGPLIIPDTRLDERTMNHPLVASGPRFRFYAGFPLSDDHGVAGGTFCVFDIKPRRLSSDDCQAFTDLGKLAQQELLADCLTAAQAALSSKLGAARREAMIDPLTRLWNRRGAATLLESALEVHNRSGAPLALAMLDLDNFKAVNDRHGHQIGDDVLRKLGSRLVAAVRAEDPVCRLGGDEFLVIMPDSDALTCQRLISRLIQSFDNTTVPTRAGDIQVNVSAGYTIRSPGDSVTADQMLDLADRALLRSKADGRNRLRAAG